MTIAGIAGCTGLLILGFGIKDSVGDVLGIQYNELFRYDCLLYFTGTDHIEENLDILKLNSDVDFAATYLEYATKVYIGNGEKTANVAIIDTSDSSELFGLRETDKKTPIRLNNDGVIISELFAI